MIIAEHRHEAKSLKGELAALKRRYLERKRREQQQADGAPAHSRAAGSNPAEAEDSSLPAGDLAGREEGPHGGVGCLHVQGETSPRGRAVACAAYVAGVAAGRAPGSTEADGSATQASEGSTAKGGPAPAAPAEGARGAPAAAVPDSGLERGAASGSPVALSGTAGMQPDQPDALWWATDALAHAAAAGGVLEAAAGTAAEPADTDRRSRVPEEAGRTGPIVE